MTLKLPTQFVFFFMLLFMLMLNTAHASNTQAPQSAEQVCHEAKDTLTKPTGAEIEYTCKQVGMAFKQFTQLWKEERYFELYDWGKLQSQQQMKPSEFATRMVELDWLPTQLAPDEDLLISFRFKTLIYVSAAIQFEHKTKPDLQFTKRQKFLLIWEDGKWKFDLLQMIRSPFYMPLEE